MGYEFWAPGLYNVLTDFGTRYKSLPLLVTEAGIATNVGERRAENIVRILEQIDRARQSGVDVRGYYHWSLMDNFEWAEGFAPEVRALQRRSDQLRAHADRRRRRRSPPSPARAS